MPPLDAVRPWMLLFVAGITIGMMVAFNRSEELRLHLRAAKNNGATNDEIREVLLHSAIYCGVPAANSAFHLAEEVLGTSAS